LDSVGALLAILISATAHNILHDFRRRAQQSRTIAPMATSTDQRPDPDLLLAKIKHQELLWPWQRSSGQKL